MTVLTVVVRLVTALGNAFANDRAKSVSAQATLRVDLVFSEAIGLRAVSDCGRVGMVAVD